MKEVDYNNFLDAWKERRAARAQAELTRAEALQDFANRPADESSKLLIILPIAVVVIGGIVAVVMLKRKKGK